MSLCMCEMYVITEANRFFFFGFCLKYVFGLSLQTSVCWRTQEGAREAGGEEGGGK